MMLSVLLFEALVETFFLAASSVMEPKAMTPFSPHPNSLPFKNTWAPKRTPSNSMKNFLPFFNV